MCCQEKSMFFWTKKPCKIYNSCIYKELQSFAYQTIINSWKLFPHIIPFIAVCLTIFEYYEGLIFIWMYRKRGHKQPPERFCKKKVFLEISQNSQQKTFARVSILIKLQAWGLQLLLKKSLAQVLSCEFFEISKNSFSTKHLWTTVSEGN